jgi:hypothetical protein
MQIVQRNCEYIKTLSRLVIFCGKQNNALHGHSEGNISCNKGNFFELVELLRMESKDFRDRLEAMPANANYISAGFPECTY